jgi:hypothetical protein
MNKLKRKNRWRDDLNLQNKHASFFFNPLSLLDFKRTRVYKRNKRKMYRRKPHYMRHLSNMDWLKLLEKKNKEFKSSFNNPCFLNFFLPAITKKVLRVFSGDSTFSSFFFFFFKQNSYFIFQNFLNIF